MAGIADPGFGQQAGNTGLECDKAPEFLCFFECSRDRLTGAEDFAVYLEKIPGVYIFLGGGNPDKGLLFPQHHDSFDIDENALKTGTALYVQYALDFLNEN